MIIRFIYFLLFIFLLHFKLVLSSPAKFLISTSNSICLLDPFSKNNSAPIYLVDKIGDSSPIDYVLNESMVLWSNMSQKNIQITHRINSTFQMISLVSDMNMVGIDGLEVDWITFKVYWIDHEDNKIEVSNLDGTFRKVLFWQNFNQLRALVLHPIKGIMFWSDFGSEALVESSNMDGTDRKIIFKSNFLWPHSLTICFIDDRIYWLDELLSKIHSFRLDGSDRKEIVMQPLMSQDHQTMGISFLENQLIWFEAGIIYSCIISSELTRSPSRIRGERRRNDEISSGTIPCVPKILSSNLVVLSYLKVVHESRRPRRQNPCQINNGNCSHLCLLNIQGYSCQCPTGIQMMPDGHTCTKGIEKVLYLARRSDIKLITIESGFVYKTLFSNTNQKVNHSISIDYDSVEDRVYWTEKDWKIIKRCFSNQTSCEIIYQAEEDSIPLFISIDSIYRNIYWTNPGLKSIQVSRLDGSSRKSLILKDLDEPRSILVAPEDGLLFWTDSGSRPKIEMALMDGSQRELITDTDIIWPNGLAYDHTRGQLFWADAKFDKIEGMILATRERKVLLSDKLPHIFDITILDDYLYWSEWQDRSILRISHITGKNRSILIENLPDVMGLKAIDHWKNININNCSNQNGGCSHLCLPTGPSTHICSCPSLWELSQDEKTCVKPIQFLVYCGSDGLVKNIMDMGVDLYLGGVGCAANVIGYNARKGEIFWLQGMAMYSLIDGGDIHVIQQFSTNIIHFTIDIFTRIIYYSIIDAIFILHPKAGIKRAFISENVKPSILAVDPLLGCITWVNEKSLNRHTIEISTLIGSHRSTLINQNSSIDYISIDATNGFIYWLSDGQISEGHIIFLNDIYIIENVKSVTTSERPLILSAFNGQLFYLSKKNGQSQIFKIYKNKESLVMMRNLSISLFMVTGQLPIQGVHPCSLKNGGCTDFCSIIPVIKKNKLCSLDQCLNSIGNRDLLLCPVCLCRNQYLLSDNAKICNESKKGLIIVNRNAPIRLSTDQNYWLLNLKKKLKKLTNSSNSFNMISRTTRMNAPTPSTQKLRSWGSSTAIPEACEQWSLGSFKSSIIDYLEGSNYAEVVYDLLRMERIKSMDYDERDRMLYWIDNRTKRIKRTVVDFKDGKPQEIHILSDYLNLPQNKKLVPSDIIIDPISRLLLVKDAIKPRIDVLKLDNGRKRSKLEDLGFEELKFWFEDPIYLGTIIEETNLKSFAVAPHLRLLIWTTSGSAPRIERANIDGSNRATIISMDLMNPVHLVVQEITVDQGRRFQESGVKSRGIVEWVRLFWLESDIRRIETVNLDGSGRKVISTLTSSSSSKEVVSMVVVDYRLYWICRDGIIESINADDGSDRQVFFQYGSVPIDLVAYDNTEKYDVWTKPCADRGCSHFCLPFDSPKLVSKIFQVVHCTCPAGFMLLDDKICHEQTKVCEKDEFTCSTNGQCIPLVLKCDLKPDCIDHSDEANCHLIDGCGPKMRKCKSVVEDACLAEQMWCDGINDCKDLSDEADCNTKVVSLENVSNKPDSSNMNYIIGLGILAMVLFTIVLLTIFVCLCRRGKTSMSTIGSNRDESIIMVARSSTNGDSIVEYTSSVNANSEYKETDSFVSFAANVHAVPSSSISYDRGHLTGASSPHTNPCNKSLYAASRIFDPPPSPATDVTMFKGKQLKKRQRRRVHCPPSSSASSAGLLLNSAMLGYSSGRDGAVHAPPPPTPRSYLSNRDSCPPSPSTIRSFCPPPPPSSLLNYSD